MKQFIIIICFVLLTNLGIDAQPVLKTEVLYIHNIYSKENTIAKNYGCLLKLTNLSQVNLLFKQFLKPAIEIKIGNQYKSIYSLEEKDVFFYSTDDPFVSIFKNSKKHIDQFDVKVHSCHMKDDSIYCEEFGHVDLIGDLLLKKDEVCYLYEPIPRKFILKNHSYRAYYYRKFGNGNSSMFNKIKETEDYIFHKFDGVVASDTVYFKL